MNRYFDRADMAWPNRSEILREKTVLVIGGGAFGSNFAMWFARAGVGQLVIVDGDVVEPHNLERSSCYTEEDVGRPKVEALARCIRQLRHGWRTRVYPIPSYLDAEFYEKWFPKYRWVFKQADLYILAVDNDIARKEAGELSCYWNVPIMDVSFGVVLGEGVGRILYFPEPRRGPCRLCFFTRRDEEAIEQLMGYNLQATCPKCGVRFKVQNWRWNPEVEGGRARAIKEGGKTVAVEVGCPRCGHLFTVRTPDAPAPALSEWIYVTASIAYYYAIKHLLGERPDWNVMFINFGSRINITAHKIAASRDHWQRHVVRLPQSSFSAH